MERGSRRSAPRTWRGARWGSRTRPSRVARCGGRNGGPPGAAGRRSLRPPARAGGFDLVFANFADQRLYAAGGAVEAGIEPVPLTPADGGFRFADLVLAPGGEEIWCVRETVRPVADGAVPDGFHLGGGVAVRR